MLIECAARRRIWSHVSFRFEMEISAEIPWKTLKMHCSRFNLKKKYRDNIRFSAKKHDSACFDQLSVKVIFARFTNLEEEESIEKLVECRRCPCRRKRGGRGARIGFTSADFLLQSMGHHRHAGWLAGRLRFHAWVPKIESSLRVGFFSTKVVPGDQIKASRIGGGRKKTEELTTPRFKKICLRCTYAHTAEGEGDLNL